MDEQQLFKVPEWSELEKLFADDKRTVSFGLIRPKVTHILSHRRILARFFSLEANGNSHLPTPPNDYFWVSRDDLPQFAVSRLMTLLYDVFFQNLH